MLYFYAPLKMYLYLYVVLMFSEGIKMEHWCKIIFVYIMKRADSQKSVYIRRSSHP